MVNNIRLLITYAITVTRCLSGSLRTFTQLSVQMATVHVCVCVCVCVCVLGAFYIYVCIRRYCIRRRFEDDKNLYGYAAHDD